MERIQNVDCVWNGKEEDAIRTW